MGTNGVHNTVCFRAIFYTIRALRGRNGPMETRLYQTLQANPIIAAVRDDDGLERCLDVKL